MKRTEMIVFTALLVSGFESSTGKAFSVSAVQVKMRRTVRRAIVER
jgi:hypothetical protein